MNNKLWVQNMFVGINTLTKEYLCTQNADIKSHRLLKL